MLRAFLDKLASKSAFPAIAPEQAFCAIGDIHGCADLLSIALRQASDLPVVCVGDYVDRGDHSAEVLYMLHDRPDVICLSGNHEQMMLRFIEDPEKYGGRWLRYGGLQTLSSFGVEGVDTFSEGERMCIARDQLVAAMGNPILDWLRSMPSMWRSGNVTVVHAGADPLATIEEQKPEHLHWGHPDFHTLRRSDGIWVLHGHTIVDAPMIANGRIAIDTGAYATGRLTMAFVRPDGVTFETVS